MRGTANGLKGWIVAVDMGLWHQRAIYPTTPLAEGGILTPGSTSFTALSATPR